jgi:hypothetical protein
MAFLGCVFLVLLAFGCVALIGVGVLVFIAHHILLTFCLAVAIVLVLAGLVRGSLA